MRTAVDDLNPSDALYTLIKWTEAEGGRPRLVGYLCPVGKPTIGWGHTAGVRVGEVITEPQANSLLRVDVADAVKAVRRRVTVPLTQGEFDALVSFVFNIRREKWNEAKCTLLLRLNQGRYDVAAGQFALWVNGRNPETGVLGKLRGLVKRRKSERALFLGEPIEEALQFITGERV